MPPPRITDPTHPAQRGLAQLVLAARHGRTRLVQCSTRPPLVVQKALYPDESVPDMAFVYLANPTGGMLGNDLHTVSVEVCSGGKAHITTQNATKIFSMTQGSARQQVNLTVSAGCYLEYLPDPIIPFHGSSFEQITSIRISPGGTLLHAEVLTPGRVAMGESFQYQRLASQIVAYGQDQYPFYREAFELTPATRNPMVSAVLGLPSHESEHPMAWNTLGSMLVLTDPLHLPSLLKASQVSLATHPQRACRRNHATRQQGRRREDHWTGHRIGASSNSRRLVRCSETNSGRAGSLSPQILTPAPVLPAQAGIPYRPL